MKSRPISISKPKGSTRQSERARVLGSTPTKMRPPEYFSTHEDRNAQLLDGVNKYVIHFNKDEIPPTLKHGFWSFTMYGSDFQLIKNPINRFSIDDRTKGRRLC